MIKPLSPKTLEKKYAALGLSKEKVELLHQYYRCFSNLYGVITVREAWDIFRNYEGVCGIRKKDFIAFSGVAQRQAGLLYAILELKEVFSGETSEDPADRLIVNRVLIGFGYGKYRLIYNTVDRQEDKPWYVPTEKSEFLSFVEDQLFLSPEGKRMVRFLSDLRSAGIYKNYDGEIAGELTDPEGNSVTGKRLADFTCYTNFERFDIDYYKKESKKDQLRKEYRTTALEKVLKRIRIDLQAGGYSPKTRPAEDICFLAKYLDENLGVLLTKKQVEVFVALYTDLNNRSHLWLNCGWRPSELFSLRGGGIPKSVSAGPNLKRLFESGEMDREELERRFRGIGIDLTD